VSDDVDDRATPPTPNSPPLPWWERTPVGTSLLLAFVKLDRVGSTREWSELPDHEVLRRRRAYVAGIEHVADVFDAAQPLHFQGDGVMLFLAQADEPIALRAVEAARLLWERVRVDLNLPVRLAVHAAVVPWDPDTGRLASPAIDACGHLEHAVPENGVAITEDVYLALPERERTGFASLGVTARDGTPAYVWPASLAARRSPEHFRASPDADLWAAFRRYALSPEVCRLRYVGLRLTKREPPSLDVRDVFVAPNVRARAGDEALARVMESLAERAEASGAPPLPWTRAAEERAAPLSLRDALTRRRALIVLGDPGAGKTTLLRWLAVTACAGPLGPGRDVGLDERLLPLLFSVGRLADVRRALGESVSAVDALARYFHDRNVADDAVLRPFLRARLDAGDALVLMDGLDEVRAGERDSLRTWLETLAAQHPRCRYVVTSRLVGYPGFALPDAVEVVLDPFDDAQVEAYVRAFHREYLKWETRTDDPRLAAEQSQALLDALKDHGRLGALARNPFLLSGMALIHRAEGRLPRHRVQVYEVFARALCETWSSARRIVAGETKTDIDYDGEALPILGHLALRMHEEWPAGVAPDSFVLDTLAEALGKRKSIGADEAHRAAREFLERASRDVQILVERGAGQWGFLHLTFQEFFVAAGLHVTEQFEEVALRRWKDPLWDEVIRVGLAYMATVQHRSEAARRLVGSMIAHTGGIMSPVDYLLFAWFAHDAGVPLTVTWPEDGPRPTIFAFLPPEMHGGSHGA
jgi:hypothetical protein